MIRIPVALVALVLVCMTSTAVAHQAAPREVPSAEPPIDIAGVARFYKVYDAAGGHPSAEQLQTDYLDPGSDGLHRLAKLRNVTGASIAKAIAKSPAIYSGAKRCMAVLPRVRRRLQMAIETFRRLYPEAGIAPVTIAVGRGKPVGVTDASGVMIGLEALCAVTWLDPNVEDRFVHVIAHEYAHVQQARKAPAIYNDKKPTVLEESLIEGAAEFAGEMISGQVAYAQFKTSTKGREKEIETAFVRDEDKTDLSDWLYNGTMKKPGDLGYWVGYRIVKSYYQHAADKRHAFRDILEMTDPKAFLAKSGWYPGIRLR
ncbi:MAG: DUF2268 domain-containing putative Zn-dependent protease [Rhodanobacteraceae bacterium]